MRVNYVLMYGTPYLKYREFETFEDVSKFLVNKSIVNYSIFKKLEDKEEVEMIYRENDIKYNKYLQKELAKSNNIIKEVREYILKEDEWIKNSNYKLLKTDKLLEILDKEGKQCTNY